MKLVKPITIKLSEKDANQAIVKGIKEISREHARASRSLREQIIPNKKDGRTKLRQAYPKHINLEDLDK